MSNKSDIDQASPFAVEQEDVDQVDHEFLREWLDHPDLYYVTYRKVPYIAGLIVAIRARVLNGKVFDEHVEGVEVLRDYRMSRAAYSNLGELIGPVELARLLCRDLGIRPQKIDRDHETCSIGKSIRDGRWYGWNAAAILSFGVGEIVEKDCMLGRILKLQENFAILTDSDARAMAGLFAEAVS